MTEHDARALLGLSGTLDLATIRAAWRKKAASLHPDRFPPEARAAKGAELAAVNAAWSLLQRLFQVQPDGSADPQARGDLRRQVALLYRAREPFVARAIAEAGEDDAQALVSAFWKGLLRGRLPQRPRPLTIVLCSAVDISPSSVQLLFEAPLPEGRAAVLVPTLRRSSSGVHVLAEQPRMLPVERRGASWTPPFDHDDAAALGVERIDAVFPSKVLDIAKQVTAPVPSGWARLLYTL